jgi:NitT/TauT family transport system permease protein
MIEAVNVVSNGPAAAVEPLTWGERLWNNVWVRRSALLIGLAAAWQLYAAWLRRPLLLPTFSAIVRAFFDSALHADLLSRTAVSIKTLIVGYALGTALAGLLTGLAAATRLGADLLELLTAMLNPLPAIALLPLAMLWFGLGAPSILFVLVHATLWPIALHAHSGFAGVNSTLRMVGQNYGLSRAQFILRILIPAAFPSILAGLKTGWAFGWRTLIAAELVFGVSSGSGGLGWFIYENKNTLEIARVFAGLGTVVLIGLAVELGIVRVVQRRTIQRWGMHV